MDATQELWLLLRGMTALVAVVALAFVTLRFGLPWLMRHRGIGARPRSVEVEEYCLLDRDHRLYVVRWGAERLLLATSAQNVQLLRARTEVETAGAVAPFAQVLEEKSAERDEREVATPAERTNVR
jgi:flagellar biogenesis protein FliO